MQPSWLSLLPPLIVIALTLILGQLNRAIIIGIGAAAFLASHGSVLLAFQTITNKLWVQVTSADMWYLYIFLVCIPSLIQLFIHTQSAAAFTQLITKKIRSKKIVELAACFSSCILSIDDYLSILTVGNVMRPIADHMGIARTKLAYLVHSLSGPLVILCPISSWVATICAYLQQSGIDNNDPKALLIGEPFYVYLQALPYIFYSLFTIFFVLFIVTTRTSFGSMQDYEQHAAQTNDNQNPMLATNARSLDLILPLLFLLTSTIIGILYGGNFYLFGGNNGLLEAFKSNPSIFLVLCYASILTLIFALVRSLHKRLISPSEVPAIIVSGFNLMSNVLTMLFLISILSSFLKNDLGTGSYLASLVSSYTTITLLPIIMFLLALVIALVTGSSWGTFGLLLPIAVPMLTTLFNVAPLTPADQVPLLYPVLGAIFSGALCGDHISLFSETTVMSAACTQIPTIVHFKTQLPYAIPVILGCLTAFGLIGYLQAHITINYWIPMAGALLVTVISSYIIKNFLTKTT